MAGLRLKIDPTGMTSGGKKAEEALDGVKTKAGGASDATNKQGRRLTKRVRKLLTHRLESSALEASFARWAEWQLRQAPR